MMKTIVSDKWTRTISTQKGTKYTFCGALELLYDHISFNWKDKNTEKKYASEYNNIILPALENHNEKAIGEYTKEDFEKAIDKIIAKGYEKNGIIFSYAPSTVNHYRNLISYVVFQASVRNLCDRNVLWGTSYQIDELYENRDIPSRVRIKKSLSVEQEIKLYIALLSDPNEPGEMVALLLMWGLGLRNSEACGVNYGDIKPIEGHPDCYTVWIYKTTKIDSNMLQAGGKTENTPRIVPVPEKIYSFLMRRRELIRRELDESGCEGTNIDDLPICNVGYLDLAPDACFKRCKADEVTEAAHRVFEKAGITSEQVAYLDVELSEENAGIVLKEKEPTAYLLRRNFATQMHILGLSYAEMQYLMGHCVEDAYESRNGFVDSESIYSMCVKLSRRSILNYEVDNNNSFPLVINDNSKVKISAIANEPTDDIRVVITGKGEVQTTWFESSTEPNSYDNRTVNILEQFNNDYSKQKR